ncbi:hypothetical protein [Paracoccus sp. J56]|uniref:hypothetical protein n=1 Tax=Paracoccus sp. J56 TaxID=935850 RepID=UPI00111C6ACC|nr:hypothetical protein [Paracoccus sp. J56]
MAPADTPSQRRLWHISPMMRSLTYGQPKQKKLLQDDQAKAVLRICEQKEEFSALVADGGKEVSEALQSLADMRLFCLAEVAGAREKQEAAPS